MSFSKNSIAAVVQIYLEENGDKYDGLCNPDAGCACLTTDLSPGNCMSEDCFVGYRDVGGCSSDCGKGCDSHVVEGPRGTRK